MLEEKLIEMYYKGYSVKKMKDELNQEISLRGIKRFFSERNMNLNNRTTLNEEYFHCIDSPQKAYWLGYLYGDGFVGSGKYNLIVFSQKDKEIIELFIKDINYKGTGITMSKGEKYNEDSEIYEIRFSNKTMNNKLREYGFTTNRKIKRKDFSEIPIKYREYFALGLVDADGSLYQGSRTTLSVCLSHEDIDWFKDFVSSYFKDFSVKKSKSKNMVYLNLKGGKKNISRFLDLKNNLSSYNKSKLIK